MHVAMFSPRCVLLRVAPVLPLPAFPFISGVTGLLTGKNFALKDPSALDTSAKAVSSWANSCLIMWSMLAYYLLEGKDVYEAMKPIMAVFMLQLIDMNFIRKTNFEANETKAFVVVNALLTYLFWAPDGSGGATE